VPVTPAVPSDELAQFFEAGISILVGSRDARLMPDSTRAVGARLEGERAEMTVFLPRATSGATLANLADNGRIAVCFSRPVDHRSIQIKGRVVAITDAVPADRVWIDRYRSELVQCWGWFGLPPRTTLRMAHWPCAAVRFAIETSFVQTPGPGAGAPLDEPAAAPRPS